MCLRHQLYRLAVWQVPELFDRLRCLIDLHHLCLPGLEVRLLRQTPGAAQCIKDLAVHGFGCQPVGIETPEFEIGFVIKLQAFVSAKNGDGRCQSIQGATVSLNVTLQLAFRIVEVSDINRDTG